MDIRLTPPLAGLAGTARAQSQGSDTDRPAAAGGVAESQKINDNNGIHEGSRSEDRDADGRQLLERRQPGHSDQDDDDPSSQANSKLPHTHQPPSTNPHLGHRLDFDA